MNVDRNLLVLKYEKALEKARNNEKLNCHCTQIESKISELKSENYEITTLDKIWVDYFNKEVEG